MSLPAWLSRLFGLKQAEVSLVAAVADDGSGASAEAGQLSPLRADPTTGALLVTDTVGSGGAASETTLAALNDKIPQPATDTLAGDQPAVPVRVVQAGPIATTNSDIPFAAALPSPTDNAQVVRVVPTGSQPEAGALAVIISPDQPDITISTNSTLKTRTVGASTGVNLSAATISADVHALHVRDTLGATETSLSSVDGKLPALVSGRVPVDGSGVTQPVSAASLPLPTGAATSALQGGGLPAALGAGGGLKVDGSGTPLPVSGTVTIDDGGASVTVDGTVSVSNTVAISAASLPLPTSAAQEHVTAGSPHAARLTDGSAFYAAAKSGDNLGADLRVSSASVSHTNPVPTLAAQSTHRSVGSTLSAAATTHTLSSSPGTLRRVEWRYTGAGTKYIVLCDQAGGTASAANWTGWYASMSNGAGKSYFEFPEGIRCASGVVLGVSATEPQAGVAITLSSNTNENFTPTFWSIQP